MTNVSAIHLRATPTPLTIRPACVGDAAALIALQSVACREPEGNLIHLPGELPDVALVHIQISQALTSDRQLLVALRDHAVIGRLAFRGVRRARPSCLGEFSILVARAHRSTGVGSSRIRALPGWMQKYPLVCELSHNVAARNIRARCLYESLGFVVEGIGTRGIRLSQGVYVDDLVMSVWKDKPTNW